MKKKILSLLLAVSLSVVNICAISIPASAEEVTGAYDYIANVNFENGSTQGWVSKDLTTSLAAGMEVMEEENGNKFLRYTRVNNQTNWYGQPVHDLAFYPAEKVSLFGGKNVVIEYKLRSYTQNTNTSGATADFGIRMNNIDRGSAHTPHSFYQKYTLMIFAPTHSAGVNPDRWGAGSLGVTAQDFGAVGTDDWAAFKIVINPDTNKVTYYYGDSQSATVNYHKYFWGMDALETLNFCMAGSIGNPGDYIDIDDVKIYYQNPAPTATLLGSTVSDEVIIQFDREIDESEIYNEDGLDTIQVLDGAGNPIYTDEEYDANARQYKISLENAADGEYTISFAGESAAPGHVNPYGGIYARNIEANKASGLANIAPLSFSIAASDVSHDASLKDLLFNGYSVSDFSSDVYEYAVEMPAMAELSLPEIIATPNNENATVEITPTTWKGERVNITVTAEDGYTKKTYYLRVKQCGVAADTLLGAVTVNADSSTVEIPSSGNVSTANLSVLVQNTAGAFVTEGYGTVEYTVLDNPEGITVNENGVVSVTEWTRPGTYTIEAIITPGSDYPWQSRIGGRTDIEITGTPNTLPFVKDVVISGTIAIGRTLTLEPYTYYQVDGKEEGESLYEWLSADTEDGEYTVIEDENERTFEITEAYENKFIRARVTPKDIEGNEGAPVESNYIVRLAEPVVSVVTISGDYGVGEKWTVSYTFFDINKDEEGETTFKWFRTKPDGTVEEIEGATSDEYVITEEDIECKICAEVTPVSTVAPFRGEPLKSEEYLVAAYPTAKDLGTKNITDNTIGAKYTYSHPLGIAEGNTRFEWYYGDSLISSDDSLNISAYHGKRITLVVYPAASKEPFEGEGTEFEFTVKKSDKEYYGGGGGGGGTRPTKPSEDTTPKPDTDVKPQTVTGVPEWAKDAVQFALSNGFMTIASGSDFGGDTNITRKEFLTSVMAAAGIAPEKYNNIFSDISADDPFSDVLQAAVNKGIISEYDAFYPNRELSREEMCKIIVTALAAASGDEITVADISHFADSFMIEGWAQEYVSKAVSTGLIKGMSETEFAPKGKLTKAQTATILQRIVNYLNASEEAVK